MVYRTGAGRTTGGNYSFYTVIYTLYSILYSLTDIMYCMLLLAHVWITLSDYGSLYLNFVYLHFGMLTHPTVWAESALYKPLVMYFEISLKKTPVGLKLCDFVWNK